jgi:hypothetical protein
MLIEVADEPVKAFWSVGFITKKTVTTTVKMGGSFRDQVETMVSNRLAHIAVLASKGGQTNTRGQFTQFIWLV